MLELETVSVPKVKMPPPPKSMTPLEKELLLAMVELEMVSVPAL